MNRLSTLGALVAGAILLTVFYGMAFGDRTTDIEVNFDDSEGVKQVIHGDRGDFTLRKGDTVMEATWRGDYTLNEDGDDIGSIDKKLVITRTIGDDVEKAVYENDGDGVRKRFYIDGAEQEGPDGEAKMRELLVAFLSASGIKADERVGALLAKGGPDAVLDELGGAYADHARQRYATALVEQTDLTSEQMRRLLEALKPMESDHDLRLALAAILEHEDVSGEDMPLFLETAERIESDYDLRRLIETTAEKSLTPAAIDAAIDLMGNLDSDHDMRRASEAILAQDALSADAAARILDLAAKQLESDHDMRILLSEAAPFITKGEVALNAWLNAFEAIDSDHDKRLALEDAGAVDNATTQAIARLIDASGEIESDHDLRLALESFAPHVEDDPVLEDAYRAAAANISSADSRRSALAAIGDETD